MVVELKLPSSYSLSGIIQQVDNIIMNFIAMQFEAHSALINFIPQLFTPQRITTIIQTINSTSLNLLGLIAIATHLVIHNYYYRK